jgi:nitrite reductase/ring-hydroxylating ferredoxin subunit
MSEEKSIPKTAMKCNCGSQKFLKYLNGADTVYFDENGDTHVILTSEENGTTEYTDEVMCAECGDEAFV